MMRVILGLVKGAIVGGAIGYGLLQLGWTGGVLAYLACAVVGALVGVVAGRAPWKAETIWTPVVKMIVGAVIGVGLCAIGFKLLPNPSFHLNQLGNLELHSGPVLAPLIGILYGIFVEVDDGGKAKEGPPAPAVESKKSK
jgi:Na+/proline symporter